jgi:hypothetical protein
MDDYRHALWAYVRYAGGDFPVRELRRDDPVNFLAWLSEQRIANHKPHTLPAEFSTPAITRFCDPKSAPETMPEKGLREEHTLGHVMRQVLPFFRWLQSQGVGLDCEIPSDEKPCLALPPPIAPELEDVLGWWVHALTAPGLAMVVAGRPGGDGPRLRPIGRALRRRAVLTQAYCLLTGMRLGELLAARLVDCQGAWLLIRESKTNAPRIIYQNPQALGIAAALRRPDSGQLELFCDPEPGPLDRVCGWAYSECYWCAITRGLGLPQKKPHQALRRACSNWMLSPGAVPPGIDGIAAQLRAIESAQLGHGGGVIEKFYMDVLMRIPAVLDRFLLPDLPPQLWIWPAAIAADCSRPERLYEQWRRIVGSGGDRRGRRRARLAARAGAE